MKPDTIATIREALELACEFVSETDEGDFDGLEIDGEWITAASVLARLDAAKVAIADLTTQAEPPAMPQDGAQWTPLPLGEHKLHDRNGALYGYLTVTPMRLELMTVADDQHVIMHGPNYRLCHLTPASPAPEGVTPNWDDAPEWAMWWAADPCCEAMWYEQQPLMYETVTFVGWGAQVVGGLEQGMKQGAGVIELPLGIDWRQTLSRRPSP